MATLPSGEKVLYIHEMLDGTMEQLIGELIVLIYRQMERLQEGCQALQQRMQQLHSLL
jgi:hypothetical protein